MALHVEEHQQKMIRPRVILALLVDPFFYKRAVAVLLMTGIITVLVMGILDKRETTAVRRGDFPAFWSLAVIANSAEPGRLYDTELQRKIQNEAWPSLEGGVLPGAYPPYLAAILRLLANFDHTTARWLWTALSVVFTYIGVAILVGLNQQIRWPPWMVFALVMMFSPLLRGVLGGQFLPVSVLLIAVSLYLLRRSRAVSDISLGIILGIWLCKPYYGLCAVLVPITMRRWLAVVTFAAVAAFWWFVGINCFGPEWFSKWSSYASLFGRANIETNAYQMPNVWAQVYRVYSEILGLKSELHTGPNTPWLSYIGAYLSVFMVAIGVLGKKAARAILSAPRKNGDLLLALLLTAVIISVPQVNFYDLGVLACFALYFFRPECRSDWYFFGVSVAISALSTDKPGGLPIHFILALLAMLYIVWRVRVVSLSRATSC